MREFNVEGVCNSNENYMVDITGKLEKIKGLVDRGKYFTINRGRQYGKTTTLSMLRRFLADEYVVISISFEGWGETAYSTEEKFCQEFLISIQRALEVSGCSKVESEKWLDESIATFPALSRHVTSICRDAPTNYVLMIDEVDKASNQMVFLNFLGKLRDKYIARKDDRDYTFHSVILAGVYDIKNIKLKLLKEGIYVRSNDNEGMQNSPWNIAAYFDVDMSFSPTEIKTMLVAYEADYKTGMSTVDVASEIYNFTGGYPILVSYICLLIHEKLAQDWTIAGVRAAVKLLMRIEIPIFESLIKNLNNDEELSNLVYHVLMVGTPWPFDIYDPLINLGVRYGHFKEVDNKVRVANKIFEIRLTHYFTSKAIRERIQKDPFALANSEGVIDQGRLNMEACLKKFACYYEKYHGDADLDFIERHCGLVFLMFISSIINGSGFAICESQSRDGKIRDILITYLDQLFVVELKIWYGQKRHERAYAQLAGYMDKEQLDAGYLLTFDSRKTKKRHQKWVELDNGKKIFDVLV